ncbi:MAG TPA: O-methyltransferase [Solirubrobacteraceae bacterium]|nr:O-methyltransferase [Solirubrobacteraceae bacterium]
MAELIDADATAFAANHTTPFAGPLAAAAEWTARNTAYPQMMAGLPEARLLEALIVIGGARRVLEVGTFTGVGALTMAAAMGEHGRVVTLELDEGNAEVARRHFAAHPAGDRIELLVGPALESLRGLEGPFDLAWIDAAKSEYPAYYEAIVDKLSPRGVIVADNLFRAGDTLDRASADPGTVAMRAFAARVQQDDRVDNVLLTIGDGVLLAWRRP